MDNKLTTPEDFLMDDSFLEYCMGVNTSLNNAWDNWISKNPGKLDAINKAKRMFAMINGHEGNLDIELNKFRGLLKERIPASSVLVPELQDPPARRIAWMGWKAAAAIILLVAGAGLVWLLNRSNSTTAPIQQLAQTKPIDLLPGGSRATLTLGSGKSVDLESVNTAQLNDADGTVIGKGEGILMYDKSGQQTEEILYNTLSTPRGGEYQLILPDGSKVWLNAASSLRFPTRFAGGDRTVYLTGEAYFEVTKNPKQPFHVQLSNGQQVEVLGTEFNVMSYDDESVIKTTLVEGKVKVKQANEIVYLRPSEQSVFTRNLNRLLVTEADVNKEIGWKLGYFEFEDEDLPTIMRQLTRWYDMDVKFNGNVPDKYYTGSISKKLTLMNVLEILKLAGVQYSLEGRKMTIKKI
jgi:transmembrane sensor